VERLIIGNATLYLGRCENILNEIGPVDALVMDPNYLIRTSGGGKYRKARTNMENIAKAKMNEGFDLNIINPKYYKSIVSFCHNDQLHLLTSFFVEHYRRHAVCYWEKTNPSPMANRNYQANIEPYVHAWQKDAHPTGIIKGDINEMKRTITTTNGKSPYNHPTVKPNEVMNKIMKNVNAETVLDCFMGTGSTGIAALKHGKKFIGIEKEPEFFGIACQRFFELYSTKMLGAGSL